MPISHLPGVWDFQAGQLESADLYERGLLDPIRWGADRLLVASGYATPSMASQLLTEAHETLHRDIAVELVVGMTGAEGIALDTHRGFESLQAQPPAGSIKVAYMPRGRAVHSKLYVWIKDDLPMLAFAGSANFTHPGFMLGPRGRGRSELLVELKDSVRAWRTWQEVEGESIAIDHPDLLDEVTVRRRVESAEAEVEDATLDEAALYRMLGTDTVILPLVMTGGAKSQRGQIHTRSGLNWGQRPEERREPNQAYIPVPASVARSGFFPPKGEQFLVTTDDQKAIIMTVAQDHDKALESPQSNSLIGEYFRGRLGVANGARVDTEDLVRYGSRFVRFYRADDETYFMEYSPDVEREGAALYRI